MPTPSAGEEQERTSRRSTAPSAAPSEVGAPTRTWRSGGTSMIALSLIAGILVYGALRVFWPYISALVLAAWASHLTRPLFRRVGSVLGGRERAAAVLSALCIILLLLPFALALATVIPAALRFFEQLRASESARGALEALISPGAGAGEGTNVFKLLREYGPSASRIAALVGGASLEAVIGAFVFLVCFYGSLVSGPRFARWLDTNAIVDEAIVARLREAFFQAGRGLVIGNGLTALVQGAVATITYLALGVPRALVLGVLSVIAALIPIVGSTVVWIPVALGLVLTGHPIKAAILAGIGLAVISTIDNVVRPYLAGRAHVGIDTAILFVSMFGGIAVLGAWGLFMGPLIVRLAAEALAIVREQRSRTA